MKYAAMIGLLAMIITLTACGQENGEAKKEESSTGQTQEGAEQGQGEIKLGTGKLEKSHFFEEFTGKIEHVHGVGYAGNGNVPFFAAMTA
ncbi:hypothetical protein [Mesobacillus foraminis]|uniref:hypothetical protein n=1 Tax=Mesobacillus foraminis TaxID=279826 RepID=UPI002035C96C|nr:hypothetical protein [Mesobacillus foraminis]